MRPERTKTPLTRGKDRDGAIKHIDKLQRIEESKKTIASGPTMRWLTNELLRHMHVRFPESKH